MAWKNGSTAEHDMQALEHALESNCKYHHVYGGTNPYSDIRELQEQGIQWLDEYDALVLVGDDPKSVMAAQGAGSHIKYAYDPGPLTYVLAAAKHPLKALKREELLEDTDTLEYTQLATGCVLEWQ